MGKQFQKFGWFATPKGSIALLVEYNKGPSMFTIYSAVYCSHTDGISKM